jgi:iron complex outermembrane receptor protein
MQNFDVPAARITGNIGLRAVQTQVDAAIATPVSTTICPRIEPGAAAVPCAAFPTAINTAGDGANNYDGVAFNPRTGNVYYKAPVSRTFNHLLPSLNLRAVIAPKLIGRFGVNRTIGRQNYNLYGAGFTGQTCNAQGCTVNGPNPDLKPMTSNNADASLGWYFARSSLLQISVFASRIAGYPKTGAVRQDATVDLVDPTTGELKTYFINTSSQQRARIEGVEIGFEQPIGGGFGLSTNISSARTRVEDGRPMVGASRISGNLGLYFENDRFSARLVYNYRGEYVNSSTAPAPTANSQGLSTIGGIAMPTAPFIAAPVSNLALSLNYRIGPTEISFNATNLTNPVRATYRYSETEQQKLDVSGRQYYLEARYKF